MASWFRWFRRRGTSLGYPTLTAPFTGFCDARRGERRCVKAAGHVSMPDGAEHDFGGQGLLDYSETSNSTRLVPAQALVDALLAPPTASDCRGVGE